MDSPSFTSSDLIAPFREDLQAIHSATSFPLLNTVIFPVHTKVYNPEKARMEYPVDISALAAALRTIDAEIVDQYRSSREIDLGLDFSTEFLYSISPVDLDKLLDRLSQSMKAHTFHKHLKFISIATNFFTMKNARILRHWANSWKIPSLATDTGRIHFSRPGAISIPTSHREAYHSLWQSVPQSNGLDAYTDKLFQEHEHLFESCVSMENQFYQRVSLLNTSF